MPRPWRRSQVSPANIYDVPQFLLIYSDTYPHPLLVTPLFFTGWALGYRVRVIATLVAGVTIALVFAWQVGLAALLCVPLIMGAAIIQKHLMSRRFTKDNGGLSPPTLLEQGLRGIASVQAYGLEEKITEDYTVALVPESKGKIQMGAVAGFVFGFSQAAVFVTFAVSTHGNYCAVCLLLPRPNFYPLIAPCLQLFHFRLFSMSGLLF